MKKIAIRSKMGDWIYYTSNWSFKEVSENIKKTDEIHESKLLSDLIQRSITKNAESVKEYLLSQDERLFNALVVAVYNGEPSWVPIEFNLDGEFIDNTVGILDFTGGERFFAIDGQHRVEGIKKALEENPDLVFDEVPVVLVGFHNTKSGKERARRLFSTLNRKAKPVNKKFIIALDEDDAAAIITRRFLEEETSNLFNKDTVDDSGSRATKKGQYLTNIQIFYDMNQNLLKLFLASKKKKVALKKYIDIRPNDEELDEYYDLCKNFYLTLERKFPSLKEYGEASIGEKVDKKPDFNILFKSIGLLNILKYTVEKMIIDECYNIEVFEWKVDDNHMNLAEFPWINTVYSLSNNKILVPATNDKYITSVFKLILGLTIKKNTNNIEEISKYYLEKTGDNGNQEEIEKQFTDFLMKKSTGNH